MTAYHNNSDRKFNCEKNAEEGSIFRVFPHIGAQPAYNRIGKNIQNIYLSITN